LRLRLWLRRSGTGRDLLLAGLPWLLPIAIAAKDIVEPLLGEPTRRRLLSRR
jgi:hypothetical protein